MLKYTNVYTSIIKRRKKLAEVTCEKYHKRALATATTTSHQVLHSLL